MVTLGSVPEDRCCESFTDVLNQDICPTPVGSNKILHSFSPSRANSTDLSYSGSVLGASW